MLRKIKKEMLRREKRRKDVEKCIRGNVLAWWVDPACTHARAETKEHLEAVVSGTTCARNTNL